MISFTINGTVVFDLAWLVDPSTWIGKLGLTIGLPVLAKVFFQSDFYRNISPFSKRYNQKLRAEIETKLPDNLPHFHSQQRVQVFPSLSFESIAHLKKDGFLHFEETEKIPSTPFSPEMPMSFHITIPATQNKYEIFNSERLGAGAFGEAYIGQDKATGIWVAVKMQRFTNTAKEQNVLIENKNLLADKKLLGQAIYEKNGKPCLVSILPLFVKDNPMHCNVSEKKDYLIAVASALKQLHQKNKIHSDLHFGNVCWNKAEGLAHLIDYGSIVDSENMFETTSHYVPKLHLPPESMFGLGLLHVKASDIFSFGCMTEGLFENTRNERLSTLISSMKHKLFFRRPSLDNIIHELTMLKSADNIVEQSKMAPNSKDQFTLDNAHAEIAQYKLIAHQLDIEIARLKNSSELELNYVQLAMMIKEKNIYQNYIQGLIGFIDLFHRFDIPMSKNHINKLHTEMKQLIELNPDYQPKIPFIIDQPINTNAELIIEDVQNNTFLIQFPVLTQNHQDQQPGDLSNKRKLVIK